MKIKLLTIGLVFWMLTSVFLGIKMFINSEIKAKADKEFAESFQKSATTAGEYYNFINSICLYFI